MSQNTKQQAFSISNGDKWTEKTNTNLVLIIKDATSKKKCNNDNQDFSVFNLLRKFAEKVELSLSVYVMEHHKLNINSSQKSSRDKLVG